MRKILMGLGIVAVLGGALLVTPGCGSAANQSPVGTPPPDLPKTPADYEASAPSQKI